MLARKYNPKVGQSVFYKIGFVEKFGKIKTKQAKYKMTIEFMLLKIHTSLAHSLCDVILNHNSQF